MSRLNALFILIVYNNINLGRRFSGGACRCRLSGCFCRRFRLCFGCCRFGIILIIGKQFLFNLCLNLRHHIGILLEILFGVLSTLTENYATKEGTTITRQTGDVEWTAIKRTKDGRYQAVADEGENGFTTAMGETFLASVYTPSFTP